MSCEVHTADCVQPLNQKDIQTCQDLTMESRSQCPDKPVKKNKVKVMGEPQPNEHLIGLGGWPESGFPVTGDKALIPIHGRFPTKQYPIGEILEYKGRNLYRLTNEEKIEADKIQAETYNCFRRAAECHRQTRKYLQSYVKPGMTMIEICQKLEERSKLLIGAKGLECGWAFPTGCSINNVAAHYTPNYRDETILKEDDVVKIDFGVQVQGRIIDSAFTVCFNPMFEELIKASKEGTRVGINEAGIDARFCDIGESIEETISSYEVCINGVTRPIRPVMNLNSHSIEHYLIHGKKSLPIVKTNSDQKMEEGEIYAIETFATCGKGYVSDCGECSHYMINSHCGKNLPAEPKAKKLFNDIQKNFGTLAFCRRWLDDLGYTKHIVPLKYLVKSDHVGAYPPLADIKNSYVSQTEHTILLRPTCKEVLSRGSDY